MQNLAVEIYTNIALIAVPFAIVFEIGNLCISTLLNAVFSGRLWIRR